MDDSDLKANLGLNENESLQTLGLYENTPVQEFIAPIYVVTSVSSSSPTSSDSDAKASVGYNYDQAKIQAGGRGYLGFRSLTTTDLQTGVRTTTTYRQNWPFIGTPLKTEVKTARGHLLSQSFTETRAVISSEAQASASLGLSKPAAVTETTVQQKALVDGTNSLGAVFVYTKQSVDKSFAYNERQEAQGALIATTKLVSAAPDKEGNVLSMTTSTLDGAGQLLSEKVVENTYYDSGVLPLRWGRLKSAKTTTTRSAAADSLSEASSEIRTATFYYFGEGSNCSSANDHTGMLCAENVEIAAGVTSDPVKTYHYYDTFGNEIFQKTESGSDRRLSPLTVYDASGRFPKKTYRAYSKALGANIATGTEYNNALRSVDASIMLSSEVVSLDKHGVPLQVHNHIGKGHYNVARAAVTPFGALYFKSSSLGSSETKRSVKNSEACKQSGVSSVYMISAETNDGGYSGSCFDMLGRDVVNFKRGFDGKNIYSAKKYDVLSRVIATSEPYQSGGPQYWTSVEYDILGRPLKTTKPIKKVVTKASLSTMAQLGTETDANVTATVDYDGLVTTYTNANGQTKREEKNALGELIKITENGVRFAQYGYNPGGKLSHVKDSAGNPTSITYDGWGRKVAMTDPDKGSWQYKYNGFGDMICQQDAENNVIKNIYDDMGRLVERYDLTATNCQSISGSISPNAANVESHASWIYDVAKNGLGQLASERDSKTGFEKAYSYDIYGRLSVVSTVLPDAANDQSYHYEKTTYDAYGRVHQQYDAARMDASFNTNGVQNVYNGYGYLSRIVNAAKNSDIYYEITGVNARGQVSDYKIGNLVTVAKSHDLRTGLLTNIQSKNGSQNTLQNLFLKWDHLGNLLYRNEAQFGAGQERFEYGNYNALTHAYFVNGTSETLRSLSYDDLGNIKNKSDVGVYTYSGFGPHAVSKAGNSSYTYDANGNMLTDTGGDEGNRTFTYNAFNKVSQVIREGKQQVDFQYGTGRSRFKRTDTDLSSGKKVTTLYIGGVEKIYHSDGKIEWKRTIAGVGQITQEVTASGSVSKSTTNYFLKDHLGSTNFVVNSSGMVTQKMAFDPWGARRNINSIEQLTASAVVPYYKGGASDTTSRGFTGHEMVDSVGIIHMNGRIYDAKLGRFLQADPIVQEPGQMVSLNRYAYGWNNPLNATDPSGYISLKAFHRAQMRVTGQWETHRLLNRHCAGCAPYIATALGFIPGFGAFFSAMFTANNTYYLTGSFTESIKSGVISLGSAYAFSAIGNAQFSTNWWGDHLARSLMHGVTGGIISVLQGGDFGNGFVSAGLTKFINVNSIMKGNTAGYARLTRVTTAAIVGGTISKRTGGKFANGAATAAMGQMLNGEKQQKKLAPQKVIATDEDRIRLGQYVEIDKIKEVIDSTIDEAGVVEKMFGQAGRRLEAKGTRYIYTKDAGWIDLQHVVGGAYGGSVNGFFYEVYQDMRGWKSAFATEDLVSNLIGEAARYEVIFGSKSSLGQSVEIMLKNNTEFMSHDEAMKYFMGGD